MEAAKGPTVSIQRQAEKLSVSGTESSVRGSGETSERVPDLALDRHSMRTFSLGPDPVPTRMFDEGWNRG